MQKFNLDNEFKAFYRVKRNRNGRRFVITDIHGYFDTFNELLKKINLNKNDQLFLLGDFIDRGKKSKEVLDEIINLIDNDYAIFPLRGNHEDMMWQAHLKDYDEATLSLPGYKWGKDIIDKQRNILPKYVNLISKLPYYYILDKFFLVHAGFDFSQTKPFEDFYSMLWITNLETNIKQTKGKTIIHGHSIKSLDSIIETVKNKELIIGLDNATHIINKVNYGNLLCLNLDSYELIVQPNIDI